MFATDDFKALLAYDYVFTCILILPVSYHVWCVKLHLTHVCTGVW